MKRVALALVAAPAIVVFGVCVGAVLLLGGNRGSDMAFVLLLFGLPASYISSLAVGVPVFLWFRRRGWLKSWQVALGGVLCSLPFLGTWFWGNAAALRYPSGLFIVICAVVIGAATAVTFQVLAREPNEA